MATTTVRRIRPNESVRTGPQPVRVWKRLKEISRFFEGRDKVHQTARRLIRLFEKAKIPYVVMGAMAVKRREDEYEARNG